MALIDHPATVDQDRGGREDHCRNERCPRVLPGAAASSPEIEYSAVRSPRRRRLVNFGLRVFGGTVILADFGVSNAGLKTRSHSTNPAEAGYKPRVQIEDETSALLANVFSFGLGNQKPGTVIGRRTQATGRSGRALDLRRHEGTRPRIVFDAGSRTYWPFLFRPA